MARLTSLIPNETDYSRSYRQLQRSYSTETSSRGEVSPLSVKHIRVQSLTAEDGGDSSRSNWIYALARSMLENFFQQELILAFSFLVAVVVED